MAQHRSVAKMGPDPQRELRCLCLDRWFSSVGWGDDCQSLAGAPGIVEVAQLPTGRRATTGVPGIVRRTSIGLSRPCIFFDPWMSALSRHLTFEGPDRNECPIRCSVCSRDQAITENVYVRTRGETTLSAFNVSSHYKRTAGNAKSTCRIAAAY